MIRSQVVLLRTVTASLVTFILDVAFLSLVEIQPSVLLDFPFELACDAFQKNIAFVDETTNKLRPYTFSTPPPRAAADTDADTSGFEVLVFIWVMLGLRYEAFFFSSSETLFGFMEGKDTAPTSLLACNSRPSQTRRSKKIPVIPTSQTLPFFSSQRKHPFKKSKITIPSLPLVLSCFMHMWLL